MMSFLVISSLLGFVLWDVSPEVASGSSLGLSIRYYGILFASGFFFGQLIISRIFKAEGKPEKDVEAITMYMLVATILGARLGHCLFYEPEYYLSNPLEIIMVWKGGLASHGAAVGILTGIYLYSRKRPGQNYLWVLDRVAIMVALGGALIRMGNLMNSEIVGKQTSAPWAFEFVHGSREVLETVFEEWVDKVEITQTGKDTLVNGTTHGELRYTLYLKPYKLQEPMAKVFLEDHFAAAFQRTEDARENVMVINEALKPSTRVNENGQLVVEASVYSIPRHPAQVYEAISTFLLFLLLLAIWNHYKAGLPEGRSFGLFMMVLFSLRFFYEFLKENQVDFEDTLSLNMGQMLSLPMIVIGVWAFYNSFKGKSAV